MSDSIYVPIIKWKQGEKAALRKLSAHVKSKISPLIEIPGINLDDEGNPQKTINEHLKKFDEEIKSNLSVFENFYVDILAVEDEKSESGETSAKFIFNLSAVASDTYIPVISTLLNEDTVNEIVHIAEENSTDICIRLRSSDFDNIDNILAQYKNTIIDRFQDRIHLLLDFEYISPDKHSLYNKIGKITILELQDYIKFFKKIIFSGTSFPETLAQVNSDSVHRIPRVEFDIWKNLNRIGICELAFSDYAISNPISYDAIDPRFLKPSANIRYTTNSEYLILKGKILRKFGFEQFQVLSQRLISMEEYSGKDYSSGDKHIYDCAQGDSCGNLTTWREVGTNHHITLVVNQLSNLL